MLFRSSNAKFTHFQGDVISNVDDSSHGVGLFGGTTGGLVQAVGDEDNVTLSVRGKGAAGVNLGSTSFSQNPILGHGFASTDSSWAAITGGHAVEITIASTRADVMPDDMLSVTFTGVAANASSNWGIAHIRRSTVNASRVTVVLNAFGSTASATQSGTIRLSWLKFST